MVPQKSATPANAPPAGPPAPAPSGIIIGHSNMDLDCLASLALARHLHPGFVALRSNRINPLARNLFHMYQDHLALASLADIDPSAIRDIVVVDTRSLQQVKEFFDALPGFAGRLVIYDHHGAAATGVEGEFELGHPLESITTHHRPVGANASYLSILLMERGATIPPEDATIALAGIFSDTGNFGHENVCPEDFTAARWLLEQGASLPLVKKFATSLYDRELTRIMHELVVGMETVPVNGQLIMIGQVELEHQPAGLAMLVERIFDIEHADAIFCVFALKKEKSHLIVARSSGSGVDVAFLLAQFGGGGHPQSASALIKKSDGVPILEHLKRGLQLRLKPSILARDLMSPDPACLREDMSLLEAALALEAGNHTGAPVLDVAGRLSGMLGLKEIQKGRKGGKMATPVKAWMNRDLLAIAPDTGLREIEHIFFQEETSRLPVVQDGRVVGLVCRSDYLALVRRGGLPEGQRECT